MLLTSADFMPTELCTDHLSGPYVHRLLRQERKANVPECEILPPERRTLPRLTKLLLFTGVMVLAATLAHADDWRQRVKSGHPLRQLQGMKANP